MKLAALFVNKFKEEAILEDLRPHGITLRPAASVAALLQMLRQEQIEAVLLEDIRAWLADWLAMLQMRRAAAVPIIVVGSVDGLGIAGALQHGASDYVDYGGTAEHLLARLRARVVSVRATYRHSVQVGPYVLCSADSTIRTGEVENHLTAREFALAWMLFENAGQVVSSSALSARVWGRSGDICKRTLEQHIYKVRCKLSLGVSTELLRIQAVYSIGYRLDLVAPKVTPSQQRLLGARPNCLRPFPMNAADSC